MLEAFIFQRLIFFGPIIGYILCTDTQVTEAILSVRPLDGIGALRGAGAPQGMYIFHAIMRHSFIPENNS